MAVGFSQRCFPSTGQVRRVWKPVTVSQTAFLNDAGMNGEHSEATIKYNIN